MPPPSSTSPEAGLTRAALHELSRWNAPSVFNGWEQITEHDTATEGVNLEPTVDLMPELPPMVGYASTLEIESGNPEHRQANPDAVGQYLRYIADQPGPTVVVVRDRTPPERVGSFWGEVNANIHRALGCIGTITDGGMRDIEEMHGIGFRALARRVCVGHAHAYPIRWGEPVEVFGRRVEPGQLIHADSHGFLAIPREDEPRLLEATRFMDEMECTHLIPPMRNAAGRTREEVLDDLDHGLKSFIAEVATKFSGRTEF